jgi:hypothetical protein
MSYLVRNLTVWGDLGRKVKIEGRLVRNVTLREFNVTVVMSRSFFGENWVVSISSCFVAGKGAPSPGAVARRSKVGRNPRRALDGRDLPSAVI